MKDVDRDLDVTLYVAWLRGIDTKTIARESGVNEKRVWRAIRRMEAKGGTP